MIKSSLLLASIFISTISIHAAENKYIPTDFGVSVNISECIDGRIDPHGPVYFGLNMSFNREEFIAGNQRQFELSPPVGVGHTSVYNVDEYGDHEVNFKSDKGTLDFKITYREKVTTQVNGKKLIKHNDILAVNAVFTGPDGTKEGAATVIDYGQSSLLRGGGPCMENIKGHSYVIYISSAPFTPHGQYPTYYNFNKKENFIPKSMKPSQLEEDLDKLDE